MESKISNYAQKTKIREILFATYFDGGISKESLIARLNISPSQFYRLQGKYKESGSLNHGLCSKPSNHQICLSIKEVVLNLYRSKYRGANYDHFCDMLSLHEDLNLKPDCVRKWLLDAKITLPRKRGTKKVTSWREPKARHNDMVQIDGTFGYFLGNEELLCLMHLVDDATRTSMAILCNAECTQSALQLLYQWCLKYGVPKSIYSDRHSTYKVNKSKYLTVEEEMEGLQLRLTDFGKVCSKLGIEHIFAHSPQAKGRVENKHKLYKDRCIKEIKWLNYSTIDEVNTFLSRDGGFTDRLNQKFTIAPREANPDIVLPTDTELATFFTLDNTRVVRNDYTVHLNKVVYQLSKNSVINHGAKVTIKQHLDGNITIFANSTQLEYSIIHNYIKPIKETKRFVPFAVTKKPKQDSNHPYRQNYKQQKSKRQTSTTQYLQFVGNYYG